MKVRADHQFRKHAENLTAVAKGLTQMERMHKDAIRRNDLPAVNMAARIHTLMAGMAAEARLRKIIWDPDGFNDNERRLLLSERSQRDRWMRTVEYAFRRHFSVPIHLDVDESTLGSAGAHAQHAALRGLIEHELTEIIGDRNRTAHGQWVWHLNTKETDVIKPASPPLNFTQIKARSDLVVCIGDLVNVLVVSRPTFERDYAKVYAKCKHLSGCLDGSTYSSLVAQLQSRRRNVHGSRDPDQP